VEVASADVAADCLIHGISQKALNDFYQKTVQNGGLYAATSETKPQLGAFWGSGGNRYPDLFDTNRSAVGMVYNTVVQGEDGATYMIMLGSELTPVDATVNTLQLQFGWITFFMLIGAFLLAFLISKNISAPIAKMNRSAKKLAEGRYDVTFDGRGYREIRELADSLNYASEELSRTDQLQREVIANVSHDLRTPLTMIRGYSEVMRDIPGENTPENLQVVVDETTRLSELVNDMLDLSRIRAGTRQPQIERFCLTDAVREVMMRYDRLVSVDGYRIELVADGAAWIQADRVMILQVIYNLINNAVNYAGEDKCIVVEQTVQDGSVRISVTDHGAGIAPEQLDRIWDRYYKVDRVHKRAAVGTGLGLSIVKGILESHRATYGVESAVGRGSSFWFSVSVDKDEPIDEVNLEE
jgi:signal transduction histidine kinase